MPLDWLTRLDPLRRVRCPFCFERFAACEMHLRCNDHYCKTDFARMIDDPILSQALNGRQRGGTGGSALRSPWWVDPRRRPPPRASAGISTGWSCPTRSTCPNCRKPTDLRLCPRCHSHLPDSAITLDPGHIAIFGPQSVGKTTYVTVLLHELDHRVGPEQGFILDPLTDEIRERYEREYHELTYGGSQFGIGEELGGESFRHSHSATPSIETNRGILQPLVYRLTRRGATGHRTTGDAEGGPALVLRHRRRRLGDEHRPAPKRGPLPGRGAGPALPDRPAPDPRGRAGPSDPAHREGAARPPGRLPDRRAQADAPSSARCPSRPRWRSA